MIEIETRLPNKILLKGTLWEPSGEATASVAMVHGLGEHVLRHTELAKLLTDRGWAVAGYDMPGHGRSPGPRGHVQRYETLLDAVDAAVAAASERAPGRPVALYGHSWGGNVALNWLLRRPERVSAAVISSPWLRLARPPEKWIVTFARCLHHVLPLLGQPNGINPEDLSRDPEAVAAYEADPLVHQRITLRTFIESDRAARFALEHAGRLVIPTLLIHGLEDRICSIEGSRELARRAAVVELREYEGRHELHHELEAERIRNDVAEWLAERIGSTASVG